ncbi:hypothetical protein JOQ06_004546 [Pogonophryne albipinna]|uniref:Transcription initiation factor IIA subunit 1 n=1 Tax=Pogonophryne albipinna TaxID=1090488 RepID=A0AAD6ANQ2_9TELE|nr:hypothetical protein JOQ06_004546 [Pogonophryne albipinna]
MLALCPQQKSLGLKFYVIVMNSNTPNALSQFMCRLQEDPTGPRFFMREQIFKATEEIPGSRCIPMQQDATCVEDLDRGNTSRGGIPQQTGVIIQPQQIVLASGNKVQGNTQVMQSAQMAQQQQPAQAAQVQLQQAQGAAAPQAQQQPQAQQPPMMLQDGQVEEEPLNSCDDVSDEEDQELFDTENVVVCQYDKIHRSKNKWKFHLKDGIMNLNGRDYVFSKAIGDAEW